MALRMQLLFAWLRSWRHYSLLRYLHHLHWLHAWRNSNCGSLPGRHHLRDHSRFHCCHLGLTISRVIFFLFNRWKTEQHFKLCASICSISHLLHQFLSYGKCAQVVCVGLREELRLERMAPTHQPIETIPSLRLIPDLTVMRPADGNETAGAYKYLVKYK